MSKVTMKIISFFVNFLKNPPEPPNPLYGLAFVLGMATDAVLAFVAVHTSH